MALDLLRQRADRHPGCVPRIAFPAGSPRRTAPSFRSAGPADRGDRLRRGAAGSHYCRNKRLDRQVHPAGIWDRTAGAGGACRHRIVWGQRTDGDAAPVHQPGLPERQPGGLRGYRGVVWGGIPDASLFTELSAGELPWKLASFYWGWLPPRRLPRRWRAGCSIKLARGHHGYRFFGTVINTWQLSQLQGTTPIAYIVFLLALRGLAVGLTLQTSFVTALEQYPAQPAAARFFSAEQHPLCGAGGGGGLPGDHPVRVIYLRMSRRSRIRCKIRLLLLPAPSGCVKRRGLPRRKTCRRGQGSLASLSAPQAQAAKTKIVAGLAAGLHRKHAGFDAAYRLTFFASIGALILAAFLPGWPAKWGGRGSTQAPMPAGTLDGVTCKL